MFSRCAYCAAMNCRLDFFAQAVYACVTLINKVAKAVGKRSIYAQVCDGAMQHVGTSAMESGTLTFNVMCNWTIIGNGIEAVGGRGGSVAAGEGLSNTSRCDTPKFELGRFKAIRLKQIGAATNSHCE